MGPAHWDSVEGRTVEADGLRARWDDLGRAAGSVEVGVTRIRVEPGCQSTPAHLECSEEEVFFVLGGSGWSWQDGRVCRVRAGDALVHRVGGEAHALVAGDDGLDVLAFGERAYAGTVLPRAGVVRLGPVWVEVLGPPHPVERESAVGVVDVSSVGPRPANVVALEAVDARAERRADVDVVRRDLARAGGSVRTGLRHFTVAPGGAASVPHVHSAEEELFVVLAGEGTLRLGFGAGLEEHPLRAGSVIARPAGTGTAHQLVAADAGLLLLAYGQRDPRDVCWYPRSRKVSVRGLGLIFRADEPLDYWDGEE